MSHGPSLRRALLLAPLAFLTGDEAPGATATGRRLVGLASWYGAWHHGRLMANGKPFDMHGRSCAHRTLPLGTLGRVTCLATGRSERVRIDDRGPYVAGRILDLSMGTADRIGLLQAGVGLVELVLE